MESIVKRIMKYNINENHKLFDYCNDITFKSKNLFNLANYYVRQCFILKDKPNLSEKQIKFISDINLAIDNFNKKSKINCYKKKLLNVEKKVENVTYVSQKHINKDNGLLCYEFLDYYFSKCLNSEANPYKLLPIACSQQVLRNLFKDWKSFFKASKEYRKNPSKFTGKPKLPRYKEKNGRHKLSFTNQSCKIKDKVLVFPKTKLTLETGIDSIKLKEVRIIPLGSSYKVEIVYDKEIAPANNLNYNSYISIDVGLKNFATIANNIGLTPIIINGKPLVSMNQYYNKKKAVMQSKLPFKAIEVYDKENGEKVTKKIQNKWSKNLGILTEKRNNKIEDFIHKISKYIINYCISNNIGNIVIGNNKQWKAELNLGKRNNQNFINIPFSKFIEMIQYKGEEVEIKVIVLSEEYTSKSSFLDLDILPNYEEGVHHDFSGKRIKRGLYKTGNVIINADVNGSYNILRRVNPNLINKESLIKLKYIPVRINPINYQLKKKKPA